MYNFISKLKDFNIDYRIIENKDNFLRILIQKEKILKIYEILYELDFEKKDHPKGRKNGYIYEYKLEEFLYFISGMQSIEIFFKLPCMSLTPKVWIPLDEYVQNQAWSNICYKDSFKYISNDVKLVYTISTSIFEKNFFDNSDKEFIKNNIHLLQKKENKIMLEKIFFMFSDYLIEKILVGHYETLYEKYVKFINY